MNVGYSLNLSFSVWPINKNHRDLNLAIALVVIHDLSSCHQARFERFAHHTPHIFRTCSGFRENDVDFHCPSNVDPKGHVVIVLATGSGDRGFKPGRGRWIFQSVKIPSMTREGKPWVPCRRFTARKRTSEQNLSDFSRSLWKATLNDLRC